MTTQYSPILKLALPVQGELSGTWGDVVNDNITSMVEQAIAGRAVINTWTTNSHTLTTANGVTSESRCAMLELTDSGTALSGAGTVICPALSKIYIVKNASGQNITAKTPSGTGILVPNGRTTFLFCDGTNVVEAMTHTTSLQLGTSTTVTAVLDEDNMASDSPTSLATQQSIKAYVDSKVGEFDSLAEVLAVGNTSGANDIIVDNGQKITVDTIDETTAAAGVTIDSVLLKDDGVNATNLEVTNIKANDGTAAATIADSTGVVTVPSAVLTTADIDGGTADNVIIGGTTPAAATATTVTANTSLNIAGTVTVTSVLDEDNMASDDPAGLATQQSIKAYVDAQVGTVDTLAEVLAIGNTTGGTDLAVSAGDDITFTNTSKAIFGTGSSLEIYGDGSNSYVKDAGTGNLNLQGENIALENTSGVNYFVGINGGASNVYHSGDLKLATTTSGIDVTGTITADGLTVDGASQLNGDLSVSAANSRIRLYETDTTDLNTQFQNQAGDFNIARLDDDAGNSTVQLNIDHATGNVSIPNGNLDVTGTVTADGLTVDGNATFTSTDTSDQFIIQNNDAGVGSAPDVVLFRNSATPADGDVIGRIDYRGKDDGAVDRDYITLYSKIADASTASAGGSFHIQTRTGATTTDRFVIGGDGNVNITGGNLDVTGAVLADDSITVDGSASSQLVLNEGDTTDLNTRIINNAGNLSTQTWSDAGALVANRIRLDHSTGDISFYEDTGTTAKLTWSAGTESLGIGVSSASNAVGDLVVGNTTGGIVTLTKEAEAIAQNDLLGRIDWFNEDNSGEGQDIAAQIGAYAATSLGEDAYLQFHTKAATVAGGTAGNTLSLLSDGTVDVANGGSESAPSLVFQGDTDTGQWRPNANTIAWSTGGSEAMRIDSSQRVLIGFATYDSASDPGGYASKLMLQDTSFQGSSMSIARYGANVSGGAYVIGKSRGAAIGSNAIVVDGDYLGNVIFTGDDGVDMSSQGAAIRARVDGTPGSNDMPGRLEFYTTAAGSATPTERMRINAAGDVKIGSAGAPQTKLQVQGGSIENGTILMGANYNGTGMNQNSEKAGALHHPVYVSDTSPKGYRLIGGYADSTRNMVQIGGGTNSAKAATQIVLYTGASATASSNTEAMRIDSSQRVLMGAGTNATSTITTGWWNGSSSYSGILNVQNVNDGSEQKYVSLAVSRHSNDAESGQLGFAKSRGSAANSKTTVGNGDALGIVTFQGADGNEFVEAARITGATDGGASADDMPGRLQFYTTADGNSSSTERMRIHQTGHVSIAMTSASTTAKLSVNAVTDGGGVLTGRSDGGTGNNERFVLTAFADGGGSNFGGGFAFETRNTTNTFIEAMRIDSSQRVLIGYTANVGAGGHNAALQVVGQGTADYHGATVNIVGFSNNSNGSYLNFGSGRSNTAGTYTIVANNDTLGQINFTAADGTNMNSGGAQIQSQIDGAPAVDDTPGRLMFSTTADGASSSTERMRISNDGGFGFNYYGSPTSLSPDTGSPLYAFRPVGGANATQNYLNFGGTTRNANGLSKMLSFNHGYWGAGREVAAIGVVTTSSSGGSGYGFGNLVFYTGSSGNGDSASSSQERMRITNDGEVLCGGKTTTATSDTGIMLAKDGAGGRLNLVSDNDSSNAMLLGTRNDTGANVLLIRPNGNVQNANNSYAAISDVNKKENIADASSQWEDIKALRVRKYSMIADPSPVANQIGVIAQEVEAAGMGGLVETVPDIYDPTQDDISVKYSILYMKAVKALQEAMDRIETLEAKVTALENA